MLQFITNESDKYSIPEQVQMAIEGGCEWIQLRMKDATDEQVVEVAWEIIPMCRENNVFLIIDDRVELVEKLRVWGVHLGKNDMNPMKAREILGPHAIIGVTANTAEDILKFKNKDVDYVGLGPLRFTTTKKNLSPEIGLEGYGPIIEKVRAEGIELPIVAVGGVTENDIESLLAQGVNGVAVSGAIINAENPVDYTKQLIAKLKN